MKVYFRAGIKSREPRGGRARRLRVRDRLEELGEPGGSVRGLLAPLLVAQVGLAARVTGGQARFGVRRSLPAAVEGGGAALLVVKGHLPCREESAVKIGIRALRRDPALKYTPNQFTARLN